MRIFWKEEEYSLITERAAILRLDHGYDPWGQTILEAQKVLPANRRRPEHCMLNNGKALFEKRVLVRMEQITAERMEEARIKRESPKPAAIQASVPEEIPVVKMSVEELLDKTIEYIAEDFKQKLLEAFKRKTLEAMDEMGTIAAQLHSNMPEVKVNGALPEAERGKRMKIGILGGASKTKDQQIIKEGLEDVYDIRFVNSLSEVEKVKYCDLILIRTAFISHTIIEAAQRVVGKSKFVNIDSRSPSAVNDWLLDRYTSGLTDAAAKPAWGGKVPATH